MIEGKTELKLPHNVILEGRRNLSVSGVTNVVSFDENMVVIDTQLGELTIRGSSLHISKTNVETGDFVMDGEFDELSYAELREKTGDSRGFFSRMFR